MLSTVACMLYPSSVGRNPGAKTHSAVRFSRESLGRTGSSNFVRDRASEFSVNEISHDCLMFARPSSKTYSRVGARARRGVVELSTRSTIVRCVNITYS